MSEAFHPEDSMSIYLREIAKGQILEQQEFNKLVIKEKEGDKKAMDMCVRAQLRLVVYMAKRYRARAGDLLFSDLIQEGNIGLLEAIKRFQPERGYKFSTYANWWIRHHISRAIADKGREVRLPVHVVETINKVERLRMELERCFERRVGEDELIAHAEEKGIPRDTTIKAMEASRVRPEREPAHIEEDQITFVEGLEDPNAAGETELTGHLDRMTLDEIIEPLPGREKQVLEGRFKDERTLEDLGYDFGLTRERIRQIEVKALRRLKKLKYRIKMRG